MKDFPILNPPPVFIEIAQSSLKSLRETGGIELPLERAMDGKLTASCREKISAELGKFLAHKSWQPRVRAVCGIGLRGVILRRITLPVTAKEEFDRVMRLQIESEFPLPPEELAWGWREISNGADKREILVAAVRKEIVEEYTALLTAAGAKPEFTLAALARNALCPQPDNSHAIIDIGQDESELAGFEKGIPDLTRVVSTKPEAALETAVKLVGAKAIFVCGSSASEIGHCRRLEISEGAGCSAATLGLKKLADENGALFLLQIQPKLAKKNLKFSWTEHRLWLTRAAVLLGILAVLPYVEPLVLKPFLAKKLASFKAEKQRFLSVVDPELHFLQFLKQNQPPYLDALYVFSKAAPPGTKMDSISIGQHGDISLRAALQNAQQLMDFRTKLIESGFFETIVVEEQTPTPDRRVNVRMTAQWKAAGTRAPVKVESSPEENVKPKPSGTNLPPIAAKPVKP
jgi:hypothetical protein